MPRIVVTLPSTNTAEHNQPDRSSKAEKVFFLKTYSSVCITRFTANNSLVGAISRILTARQAVRQQLMKNRIIQHSFGSPNSGGPVVALQRLLDHSTRDYFKVEQTVPAGGVSLCLLRHFHREFRRVMPSLVHVRGLGNEGFHAALAARLARVPYVLVSVHGTQRDLRFPRSRIRRAIVAHVLEPLTLLMATHIATVCEYAADRPFVQRHRKKLVGVVPNGIPLPRLPCVKPSPVRADYAVLPEDRVGITVSRLTAEKGFDYLADAFRRLDAEGTRLTFFIVGGGDADGSIKAAFQGLTQVKVIFTGQVPDVSPYLAASDFFVLPSLHENLSNALLEAMSFGLPAIATAVGGNTEILSKGGGHLISPGSSEDLAAAITEFVTDSALLSTMSSQARLNVEQNYSIEVMVRGWERIYDELLSDNG